MNNDYCHVTLVLDKSGSMRECWSETIDSVKSFLAEQRKLPGKMTFSFYTFSDKTNKVLDFVDIQQIQDSVLDGIVVGGWTAIWDAAAYSMMNVGDKLHDMKHEERPAKILFVFLTDGEENMSKKSTQQQVKEIIEHQKSKYNWNFVFLGADFDAAKEAESVGSQWYNYNKYDTAKTIHGLSHSVSNYRGILASSYNSADIGANN